MENENCKNVFLNIGKKGKSNEMLKKILLEEYKKRSKKTMVKKCYIKGLLTVLKINMARMKAAISCAFKHW